MDLTDLQPFDVLSRDFVGRVLDDDPRLVKESYRLRYQVYCHERGFLDAADYPMQLETDIYDPHAIHLGVLDRGGQLVATARLVQPSELGLPMLDHCTIVAPHTLAHCLAGGVVEVSRLAVSRLYNRRAGDNFYGLQGPGPARIGRERRVGGEVVLALYKALYQASKRRRLTHWLMAAENSLRRLVTKYGFPFKAIGPEVDYYGLVAPYAMDLSAFDRVITSGRVPFLREFFVGLEPEFRPVGADPDAALTSHG